MPTGIRSQNLILPELSYKVVGALFEVFDELGYGFQEKHYYRAVKQALEKRDLKVKEQVRIPLQFRGYKIGDYYLDFLVNDELVLELKIGARFRKADFEQVKGYLKAN